MENMITMMWKNIMMMKNIIRIIIIRIIRIITIISIRPISPSITMISIITTVILNPDILIGYYPLPQQIVLIIHMILTNHTMFQIRMLPIIITTITITITKELIQL